MNDEFYSERMRASKEGRHLSGAERIGRSGDVSVLAAQLTDRAMTHGGGRPDEVVCTFERLPVASLSTAGFPDVRTWQVNDWSEGRRLAGRLLTDAGVEAEIVERCLRQLDVGPAPGGGPMRGAMILDVCDGTRLEPDQTRGVRVSHMDVDPDHRGDVERRLTSFGLVHHRVLEALVLSAKVLQAPGIVAELCWSDDPDYVAGYIASPHGGYQRITQLKPAGDPRGGRVLLVDGQIWRQAEFIHYLEKTPVLLQGVPVIHPARSWRS